MAALVVVVVSTSGTISGVTAHNCVCEEGASAAGSIMVRVTLAATALTVESGSGAESPSSWAAPATAPVVPWPSEP
jgi:hypothetical protein